MIKLALILATAATLCLAADPFVGSWKPSDVEKWKTGAGGNTGTAKSRMITIESVGKNYRLTYFALDGKPIAELPPVINIFDGKPHPRANVADGTVKWEHIDDHHHRQTLTGPKGTVVVDYVISPDGKTQTATRKGVGVTTGRQVDELLTWAKQP
jgi:hypothetical protein